MARGSLMRAGCRTRRPRRTASTLVGGAASTRPRPFSPSGCVTSAATSCPASSSASSEGTAKAPVPRKTALTPAPSLLPIVRLGLLAELALEQVALERRQAVDEEQPVDVVDLVAEDRKSTR